MSVLQTPAWLALSLLAALGCSDGKSSSPPPASASDAGAVRIGVEVFVTGRFAKVDVSYQSDAALERVTMKASAPNVAIHTSDGSAFDTSALERMGPITYRLLAPTRTGCDRAPELTFANGTLLLSLEREGPAREVAGCLDLARALEKTDETFEAAFDAQLPDGRKTAVSVEIDAAPPK